MAQKKQEEDSDVLEELNQVRLVGRLLAPSEEKTLPSGDTLQTFRVTVRRAAPLRGKQTVDSLECVAWDGRVKRSVGKWRPGDVVEVTGALRRRFFRTPAGAASRAEVEVTTARVVRRAPT